MIGNKLILSKIFFVLISLSVFSQAVKAQVTTGLEKKAVAYFCSNVTQIDKNLIDFNIKFKGYTVGKPSRIYIIADCIRDISLIKDSIPNVVELDSLVILNDKGKYDIITITQPEGCSFLKKAVFAPFNRRIYTLQVFNAIEYKESYFVELYLTNRNLSTWIICIEFSKDESPIGYCTSFILD